MAQISYINHKDILEAGRYDAEYFKPEYLEIDKKITKFGFKTLGSYIELLTDYTSNGSFASLNQNVTLSDNEGYAKWIRINELDKNDFSNCRYIDEKGYFFLKKTKLFGGELLISKTGEYLGKAFIVPELKNRSTLADNIFLIKLKDGISKEFIKTYINSYIGQCYIKRLSQGVGQPTIIKDSLRKIKIPNYSELFKNQTKAISKEIDKKQIKSQKLYLEAENILLEELGLLNYQIKNTLTFSTTKKEIKNAKRCDSEYFQPKYTNIVKKIEEYGNGWDYVKTAINLKDKNFNPKDQEKYKYLALSNISNQGYVQDYQEEFGKDLPTRARRKINTRDLIISSIEGSLSSCALIEEEFNNSICSTGFFVLNSEKINSETLLILFKSEIIQELLKRGSKGTILTAISKTELESIKIPLIKPEIQEKIAEKIQESHKLRKESKELLEEAKRKVEEEIEKQSA